MRSVRSAVSRSANVSVSGFSSQVQPCFASVRPSTDVVVDVGVGASCRVVRDPGAEVQDDPSTRKGAEHLLQDGEGLADAAVSLPVGSTMA